MPRPPRIFSLLSCFFSGGGAPQLFFFSCAPPCLDFLSSSLFFLWWRGITALFLLLCPPLPKFSLFFPAFSLVAGHHSSLSSPVPRPPRIFSLLPCFFSGGGAPQLSFFSHAQPCLNFLSSFLLFLWWRGTTALFLLPCPARPRFSLFFPAFSLAAGHHSSFSSPMPRPA